MAFTAGSTVDDADYDALFTTLEAIRAKHVARKGISSANKTKLQDKTLGGNVITVNAGTQAKATQVQEIKDSLKFIETFAVDLSGFSSKITVPAVGDLLKASVMSGNKTALSSAQSVCANCSFNSSYDSSVCSFNSGFNPFGSWNSSWNGVVC